MSSKKAEARERVKAMREEQARRDRRRERTMRFGVAGAVVAAVAIIAIAVAASRGGDGPVAVPEAAGAGNGQEVGSENQGIMIGDASAPVTIDYWMDFLCPHCKEFHDRNGEAISQMVEAGDANIVYHPVTYTGNVYSTRANNAFACAADEGKANEFIDAAFASQQQWSTSTLVDLGEQAGIGGDYESCVRDDTYEDWSSNVESQAQNYDVTGTPTTFINGQLLPRTSQTPDGITSAVEAVAAGGDVPTPSPQGTQAPEGGQTGGAAGEQPSAQPTQ
ncbi:protein-disulfide isomerase [Haloactinopolyspora alba]|uniref:Protein-disulfide isomerase n=1 Tax=Haloactinopolyspora alba TaxID=648780 RepID=A0A2P8E423_9ACTN|nr:thioredoxin domain-containing protein [Haloactinopolyspora alba]PSL04177.1 protein-disulfide isomerase [Haloactinopolyspora alba]